LSRRKDTESWLHQIASLPGVSIRQSRGTGHWLVSLDGRQVTTVAHTGGRGRGLDNAQAEFRRALRAREARA
jgi:hypothetical protein